MVMELHQLRYAIAVARRGSFTAAAEELHVSQSGVSAQVAKLERDLGVRLFVRGSRAVTTSADGAVLLPRMEAALQEVERVRVTADELAGACRGRVRVGTVIGCTIPEYLDAFADFRNRHPTVEVSAIEGNSDDLVTLLTDGHLDVAIVAHAKPLPPELRTIVIVDEPIVAGIPDRHPWAGSSAISLGALADEPVLTLPRGTGVRAALDRTCRINDVEAVPDVEAHSPQTVLALAGQGVGVAVLSPSMIDAELHQVHIRGAVHTQLSLAFQQEQGAAARAFIALLADRFQPGHASTQAAQ